ncbi:MAG: DEAD/DEAH box helicase family protein, partial [Erysipelotrichaceae bacterium]|nr:DEAD/DEAH box helicase family protein [Erysipelotrichaceae bacterium]
MKAELFPFQKRALSELRMKTAEAIGGYQRTHSNQVVSFTAPTGAGKTIIMASLIESIFFGDVEYPEQPDAIIIWLSDSPQLNEQSKNKIDLKADRIRIGQCVTISEDSFDQEQFDDGHIYFLNTQKLGKSSNLTKKSDARQYTIWETLANTARDKSDRLYVIIDEAHRGMQGREAGRATTIMQKFLKGSPDDGLEAMPVVIGMSATSARFNALVQGTTSTTQYVVVTTDEVRASGLLKDRIVISYPEENTGNKDMAVLQAAADEWKDKWDHWYQYCYEQHYAYVNPILVIQVQNGTGSQISATDLDDCVAKVEERCGIKFQEGEVVHTFGQTNSVLTINGLNVPYVEPSAIAENKKIRVVFFKESLSTGWDCPRAETMMSFRHATDATYIAQLLGRMIRTPMQMHIQVDDTLNDVHLYLPYFNADTVSDVVKELQNAEGGELPTDIYGESLESRVMETLTVRPRTTTTPQHREHNIPGQMSLFDNPANSG